LMCDTQGKVCICMGESMSEKVVCVCVYVHVSSFLISFKMI
jgi:hypothetical protein